MSRFKEALLDELVTYAREPASVPAENPRPARRARLVWTAGLAGAGAAAAAVVATIVVPAGQQAAYAVDTNPNGTVTITFRELGQVTQATRALRAAGVRAQVVRLAEPGSCATTPGGEPIHIPAGPPGSPVSYRVGNPPPYPSDISSEAYLPEMTSTSMTINPAGIPPDAVLYIVEFAGSQDDFGLGASLTTSPAPTCWEGSYATPVGHDPRRPEPIRSR